MPSFSDDTVDAEFVKMLYIGASGAGKTGSLVSLVEAGYKLRLLDGENGYPALKYQVMARCPDKAKNVEFEVVQDRYKMTSMGPKISGTPRAFVQTTQLLDKWSDGSDPGEWGADTFLVLETLTSLGRAAFEWAKAQNPMTKDPRQWYSGAQEAVDNVIGTITSKNYRTNLIVTSHIDFVEKKDEMTKGWPTTIGKALGPKIGRHFNSLILAERTGSGRAVRRKIKTAPTAEVDLKMPIPIEAEYPLESGLATIVEGLTGGAPAKS